MMLQGPIPPHAPQGSPLAACMVVLLAVLLVGVVHLRNVLRRKRDEADAFAEQLRLDVERRRADNRRRRADNRV